MNCDVYIDCDVCDRRDYRKTYPNYSLVLVEGKSVEEATMPSNQIVEGPHRHAGRLAHQGWLILPSRDWHKLKGQRMKIQHLCPHCRAIYMKEVLGP